MPELQFPVMTHVGRSNALIRMGRIDEADAILARATEAATKTQAHGYQAQLLAQRAQIASDRKQHDQALAFLNEATAAARFAGANRLVAEIALTAADMQRERG